MNHIDLFGFNSTLVQLKDSCVVSVEGVFVAFQFHSGSIKSIVAVNNHTVFGEFQFHSGSIKRSVDVSRITTNEEFQFHSGSIKRIAASAAATFKICVSIPLWFN